jgi:hypothetical protein
MSAASRPRSSKHDTIYFMLIPASNNTNASFDRTNVAFPVLPDASEHMLRTILPAPVNDFLCIYSP